MPPFIVQNLKTIVRVDDHVRVMTMRQFCAQNDPFAPNNFFGKAITIIFMHHFAPMIKQNLKKYVRVHPEL